MRIPSDRAKDLPFTPCAAAMHPDMEDWFLRYNPECRNLPRFLSSMLPNHSDIEYFINEWDIANWANETIRDLEEIANVR